MSENHASGPVGFLTPHLFFKVNIVNFIFLMFSHDTYVLVLVNLIEDF